MIIPFRLRLGPLGLVWIYKRAASASSTFPDLGEGSNLTSLNRIGSAIHCLIPRSAVLICPYPAVATVQIGLQVLLLALGFRCPAWLCFPCGHATARPHLPTHPLRTLCPLCPLCSLSWPVCVCAVAGWAWTRLCKPCKFLPSILMYITLPPSSS